MITENMKLYKAASNWLSLMRQNYCCLSVMPAADFRTADKSPVKTQYIASLIIPCAMSSMAGGGPPDHTELLRGLETAVMDLNDMENMIESFDESMAEPFFAKV